MVISGRLGRVANDQIEGAWGDFAKAAVTIQRNSDADRGIVSGEAEAAFQQTVVNLIHVQRPAGFAQNHSRSLRNRAIEEAIVDGLNVSAQGRHIVSRWSGLGQFGL